MEQLDTAHTDIDKAEEQQTIELPASLEIDLNSHHDVNAEGISKDRENIENNCKEIITDVSSVASSLKVEASSIGIVEGKIIEPPNNDLVREMTDETFNDDLKVNNNKCVKNERTSEETQIIEESIEIVEEIKRIDDLSSCKEESMTSLTESKIHKCTENLERQDVCTVTGTGVADNSGIWCQTSLESLHQNYENKNHSSRIGDSQLTKLVDGDAEVVVLTVETVPVTNSNEMSKDNIVVVHGKDVVGSNENKLLSVQEKDDKTTEVVNDEFDIIDYSQESDGTIIEVISTEVVHSGMPETCTQQDGKELVQSIISETNTPTLDPAELVTTDVVDNSSDIKCPQTKEYVGSNAEDSVKRTQSEINPIVEPQHCDSREKGKINEDIVHSRIVISPVPVDNPNEDNICVNEANKVGTAVKKRSVIQDIFDDWGDENAEDDGQAVPKVQDTVEIELKNLLEDTKSVQSLNEEEETIIIMNEKVTCMENEGTVSTAKTVEIKETKESYLACEQIDDQNVRIYPQNAVKGSSKEQVNVSVSQSQGKSSRSVSQGEVAFNQTSPPHVTPILSRGRNLISQIASSAEVTEALKERLREQQKLVEPPRGPDIFFVKKLTQRLSSKLAGGPVTPMPALIPLPQSSTNNTTIQLSTNNGDRKSTDHTSPESGKESNSDNKELLAILEGDVDPDWSNLKPPTLTEEAKGPINIENDGHNTPPKLDPLVERELALKQLLELPVTPLKKVASRKKKTFKPAPSKAGLSKETEVKEELVKEKEKEKEKEREKEKEKEREREKEKEMEIVDIDLIDDPESPKKNLVPSKADVLSVNVEEQSTEKGTESVEHDVRIDESRSGRKRKPTEKARENEQNSTKRQKVYKGKIFVNKKQTQENDGSLDTSSTTENHLANDTILPISTLNAADDFSNMKEATDKQLTDGVAPSSSKPEDSSLKRPKQNLTKKSSQPISKRKIVVKKLLRQNMPPNKKPVKLKSKLSTSSKKSGSKIVSKSQKRAAETSSGDAKPKKKIINEIDRLLQDEGVVNLLYDVEQPDKKRLIPITKSHAKVMDIQKVQRELKIRKKLVRNAVLRLRTTTSGVSKVSPRSKRTPSVHAADTRMDKKSGGETPPLKTANAATSQEFIIPAKIRNAADASIIIRRHSSSSFSSASGSPRVSIDGADKFEGTKLDEGGSHSLRSTKRRHSQDERINLKKSKKKAVQKVETETATAVANIVEDKVSSSTRPSKKADSKRSEKNLKQVDATVTDETNSNSSKVITRSNGTATGKVTSKNKKTAKSKVTFAKTCEPDNDEEPSKEEDELSACLAEAATALSVVNAANRSGNTAANRKNKVNPNNTKTTDFDNSKGKTEIQSQFSNKEINVRRHGNLVQLILTPSSPTKIRNALTLQVMHEFREALSILKKDDECRVVLLTSTGTSFCEGLELSMLLHANKEERRVRAQELADTVKDFIKSLATFNKPIVAGVQGAAIGLGVTMLPLFDLVIASDKATFSTPYGKLGQIAEGAAVFTLSHILGSAITSELLLGGRTLTASEALRAGLVTRVLWPDRFQVELLPTLRAMSDQSAQSMEATKTLLRHSLRRKLDAALESETYLLIQHWCSAECQTAIMSYIDGKVQ